MRSDFVAMLFERRDDAGPDRVNDGRRILVIDDDDAVRTIFQRYLESAGFSVVTAKDGAEGLRRLALDRSIRLVLLDLLMPDMDGWRFRHAQQCDQRLADIPV